MVQGKAVILRGGSGPPGPRGHRAHGQAARPRKSTAQRRSIQLHLIGQRPAGCGLRGFAAASLPRSCGPRWHGPPGRSRARPSGCAASTSRARTAAIRDALDRRGSFFSTATQSCKQRGRRQAAAGRRTFARLDTFHICPNPGQVAQVMGAVGLWALPPATAPRPGPRTGRRVSRSQLWLDLKERQDVGHFGASFPARHAPCAAA